MGRSPSLVDEGPPSLGGGVHQVGGGPNLEGVSQFGGAHPFVGGAHFVGGVHQFGEDPSSGGVGVF